MTIFSPAAIPGRPLKDGCIVPSPGVSYPFDREAERKLHIPLRTGVLNPAERAAFSVRWAGEFTMMTMSDKKGGSSRW